MFCLILSGCDYSSQEIQFFTHEGCPYCAKALKYIQINYPKLPVKVMEISTPGNMRKFVECANKFHLDKQNLGTPLICINNHYIMGWSSENQKKFNDYIQPYLKKK